jgi:hypothetical protein
MLAIEHAPTLAELLQVHPAEAGIIELVGYVQIASEDGHLIEPAVTETVTLAPEDPDSPSLVVTIPRVTFIPPRRNGHAR